METTPNVQQPLDTAPSAKELEGFHREQASQQFLDRNRREALGTPGAVGDSSVELQLQAVQQELSREVNPMRREMLEQQAWALASSLVSGDQPKSPKPVQRQEAPTPDVPLNQTPEQEQEVQQQRPPINAAEDLIADRGQEAVTNTLQWAGETLSEEVSVALNEVMEANDESTYEAYSGIEQLKSLPSEAIRTDAQVGYFDPGVVAELESQYGEAGTNLAAINVALATGKASRADAIRMVMSDPALAAAAFSAARDGLIQLAL